MSGDKEKDFRSIAEHVSVDEAIFKGILRDSQPAVLKNCSFGKCLERWNLEYLREKLDQEPVIIHESSETDLNFIEKNFKYKQCNFSRFADLLIKNEPGTNLYLRSTNQQTRAKKPARIEDDFPNIKEDLLPASFIPFGQANKLYQSSVLRIASVNVQIWTHFDLYDNVLCQVVGTKRIILLPPSDIKYLYVIGDKSRLNDFDNLEDYIDEYPLAKKLTLYKCNLKPGDSLFIPALWWHNIRTLPSDHSCDAGYSIGFNIFWKDESLEAASHYAINDVYGNANLKAFDAALANLDKALAHLDKLPEKFKNFYKIMLLERIKNKLSIVDCN